MITPCDCEYKNKDMCTYESTCTYKTVSGYCNATDDTVVENCIANDADCGFCRNLKDCISRVKKDEFYNGEET